MGCGGSTAASSSNDQPLPEAPKSALKKSENDTKEAGPGRDSEVGEAVQLEKKTGDMSKTMSGSSMYSLALQFDTIGASFKIVHTNFDKYHSTGEGVKEKLCHNKLSDTLKGITGKEFSEEEIKELFHLSSIEGDSEISFKEFLIAVAVGYYLKENFPEDEEFMKAQKGFKVVEDYFQKIDADKGGTIDMKEFKDAMFTSKTNEDNSVLNSRFKELDFDEDGSIGFNEFLYGIVAWVGLSDDE